jgi:hypothetical protein
VSCFSVRVPGCRRRSHQPAWQLQGDKREAGYIRETAAPASGPSAGVRMDKRLVKVLKALAELYDLSLGQLIEDLVRGAFAGRQPFFDVALTQIAELMAIYGRAKVCSRRGIPGELTRTTRPPSEPARERDRPMGGASGGRARPPARYSKASQGSRCRWMVSIRAAWRSARRACSSQTDLRFSKEPRGPERHESGRGCRRPFRESRR